MRRNREDDYHLYEMNADGRGLRQLTFGRGVTDIDPIYLPDGRILFTSTREPKYCMCNRHIMGNLFTMEADGANMQQIGHSTLHEGHAVAAARRPRSSTTAGSTSTAISATRRACGRCNPDGTNHAVYWGNNTNSPGAVLDARAIPGTELVAGQLLLLPRPALGGAGDRRPPPGAGRPPAGAAHLAGRRDRPGRPGQLRHVHPGQPEVRRSLSAVRQVLPLLADDRPRRADGDLPARRVRQRGAAARRGAGLLRSDAAGAAASAAA